MNNDQDLQQQGTSIHDSQLAIEAANRDIKLFEQYKKLTENQDFVDVIITGYLQEHSTELFESLLDGTQSTKDEIEKHMRRLEAIGELTNYVTGLHEKAQLAKTRIERERAFIASKEDNV